MKSMFRDNKTFGYLDQQSIKLENKKAPVLILPDGSNQLNRYYGYFVSEKTSNTWENTVNYKWWCLRLPLQHSGVSLASLNSSHIPKSSLKGSNSQEVES